MTGSRSTAEPRGESGREGAADALARLYDLDLSEDPGDVELYLALAVRAGGPIVELAVGTGRIAVPLASAGHEVIGVDDDPAMLGRARSRIASLDAETAARLRFARTDMLGATPATIDVRHGAGLVILGLNSILLLADRDRQRRVFRAMAGLLRPGGVAVVDAWLPSIEDLARFDGRLSLEWLRTEPTTGREVVKLAAAWYEPATRHVTLTTVFEEGVPGEAAIRWTRSDALRLVDADELVDFASEAGLELEQLAGDYDLGPFGPGSDRAIVIARRPG